MSTLSTSRLQLPPILSSALSQDAKSDFALKWRQTCFDANAAWSCNSEPPKVIETTHRQTLFDVLDKHPDIQPFVTQDI